jgi:hypothetical protein
MKLSTPNAAIVIFVPPVSLACFRFGLAFEVVIVMIYTFL